MAKTALAKLPPAERAEVVTEVVSLLNSQFKFYEEAMNNIPALRYAADCLRVPYLVMLFAVDVTTSEEHRDILPADAMEYARWQKKHGKGAE